ncbi:DUF177 domain-containing protein [Ramlibacter sp.]|uniref:YceD family protein n=1 Tax=Ramlibacter sp. TaxID=1917967 RepID=UPI0017A1F500|nr:DUF177 domain-containing protein [Ramlibacter sp.]MBA2674231.1 DUF177 domain-containing protein [Ramlibacter sp.]
MKKEFDARRLDVKRFAESGAQLESDETLGGYARLLGETQGRGAENAVHWEARGELGNPGHLRPGVWMHLRARAVLPLVCQRCLAPVDVEAAVERAFRFVEDEDTAATKDDASDEDVLALSRSFDLVELVEDELLMDLPVAPRHEVCPETLPFASADAEFEEAMAERPRPFAALARLKSGKH